MKHKRIRSTKYVNGDEPIQGTHIAPPAYRAQPMQDGGLQSIREIARYIDVHGSIGVQSL